jgi:aspartyl-tRNA(Asn)/glutamyl-tRNA(Gln) amidotransferase subunit A
LRAGRVTSRALVESCLERIAALDSVVKAWTVVDAPGARQAADRLDAEAGNGRLRGPLHGVPVGIKDIFHVAGLRTRAGTRGIVDVVPEVDAVSVARLRTAGAVILGKLHTTEFAYADPAPTVNPWNPSRTPGGSSSGSAAAVAARMVPLTLGTQTVGSTIRPAAFCGTVGLKPSYGAISRRGVIAAAWSLDHVGIFARTVDDAALAWSVLADGPVGPAPAAPGADSGPSERSNGASRPPRLGIVREPFWALATPDTREHVEQVGQSLAEAGASLALVPPAPILAAFMSAIQVLIRAEAAARHADLYREHAVRYRPQMRAALEAGMCIPAEAYLRAQRLRRHARRTLVPLLGAFDAVLMPAAPGVAPGLATTGDPSFNAPWSGIGAPQIALPIGLAHGLPLGIQLIGAPGTEARLIDTARFVESVVGFAESPADPILLDQDEPFPTR